MRSNFENLRVYQLAEQLADEIWTVVASWNKFSSDTVGRQIVLPTALVQISLKGQVEAVSRITGGLSGMPGARCMRLSTGFARLTVGSS